MTLRGNISQVRTIVSAETGIMSHVYNHLGGPRYDVRDTLMSCKFSGGDSLSLSPWLYISPLAVPLGGNRLVCHDYW